MIEILQGAARYVQGPGALSRMAQDLRGLGLSAAVFPVEYAAGDAQIAAYADAARGAGLCIAEVGAWSNPLSEIPEQRQAALEKCKGQLRLAEELGARCCVNIAGAFRGARWDGFHRANYTQEAFEATVRSIQEIIDSVKPQKTYYCMEAMEGMTPGTPQQYLDLLRAVDREAFAVHIDITNWVYSPKTYLYNREHDWDLSPENSGEKPYPRRIKGGDIAQIRRIADKFSPRTSFEDRKGWGTVRIDSLSNVTISTLAQDDQTMPNVVGMGLKDALFLLESRGLRVSFSGRGSVQYQSIAPGTRISRGGAVTITLK